MLQTVFFMGSLTDCRSLSEKFSRLSESQAIANGLLAYILAFLSIFTGSFYYSLFSQGINFGEMLRIFYGVSKIFLIWIALLYFLGHWFFSHLRRYYLSPIKFMGFIMLHFYPLLFFNPIMVIGSHFFDSLNLLIAVMVIFLWYILSKIANSLEKIWHWKKNQIWILLVASGFISYWLSH